MTTVRLTWDRLGRKRRVEGDIDDIEVDRHVVDGVADAVYGIAARNLMSHTFTVHAVADDDDHLTGRFSIDAGRFGGGRWKVTS